MTLQRTLHGGSGSKAVFRIFTVQPAEDRRRDHLFAKNPSEMSLVDGDQPVQAEVLLAKQRHSAFQVMGSAGSPPPRMKVESTYNDPIACCVILKV